MPASPRETVLCRYHYDPLDGLVDSTLLEQDGIQRFYCKSRLATEIQGAVQCSIFQHDDQLLAQQHSRSGKVDTNLLATDQQRSVLNALDMTGHRPLAYTPYGHRSQGNGLFSLLGFNGERPDPVTGHYHLGNGYRQFNPVLMRFNSPDSWSPFGEGGLNAYAYCAGDPVNRTDPTGHGFLKNFISTLSRRSETGLLNYHVKTALTDTKKYLGKSSKIKVIADAQGITAEQLLLEKAVTRTISIIDKKILSFENLTPPPTIYEIIHAEHLALKSIAWDVETFNALGKAVKSYTTMRPGTHTEALNLVDRVNHFSKIGANRITNERLTRLSILKLPLDYKEASRMAPRSSSTINNVVRRS